MDIVIGIDPQVNEPAVSRFIGEKFTGASLLPIHKFGELCEKIKKDFPGCKLYACIEIPFLKFFETSSRAFNIDNDEYQEETETKAVKINPETFRKQCESVGRIKEQIEPYCLQVFECRPSEWYMAIIPRAFSVDRRDMRKRQSIAYYRMRTGIVTKNDNISDAFAIGEFGNGKLREYKLNKRIKAQKAEK